MRKKQKLWLSGTVISCLISSYAVGNFIEVKSSLEELESTHTELKKDFQELASNHESLQGKHEELSVSYDSVLDEKNKAFNLIDEKTDRIDTLELELDKAHQTVSQVQDASDKKDEEIDALKKLQQAQAKESKQTKPQPETKWKTFHATYYDANFVSTGKNPGDPGYGLTASGRKVEQGVTVAVDPDVIPLGTWIKIKHPDGTVETRRADDTGSAINGRDIDIYLPKASITSGSHSVKVKILKGEEDSA